MKHMLIFIFSVMIFTLSAEHLDLRFTSSLLRSDMNVTLVQKRVFDTSSTLSTALTISYDSVLTLHPTVSYERGRFVLGDISRDIRFKALDGSYLTHRRSRISGEQLKMSPGNWEAMFAAVQLLDGGCLAAGSTACKNGHTISLSFLSPFLGCSVRNVNRDVIEDASYIDFSRIPHRWMLDAYLLLHKDSGRFSVESYLNLSGSDLSSKNVIDIALSENDTLHVTQIWFSRYTHEWDIPAPSPKGREKLRSLIICSGKRGDLSYNFSAKRRVYASHPFASYRGEEEREFLWELGIGGVDVYFKRVCRTDPLSEIQVASEWGVSMKRSVFQGAFTCSYSFTLSDRPPRHRLTLRFAGEKVQTKIVVTHDDELSVTLSLTYHMEGKGWKGKGSIGSRGLEKVDLTIGR